jgi:hypothetical protein
MLEVSNASYYYPFIIAFIIMFAIIEVILGLFKMQENEKDQKNEKESFIANEEYITKGRELKKKYMVVYLLCKSAMWAKAPYTFMLFSTYYKFTIPEIGVLYLIDAVFALIAGPFLGVLSDTFGRKFTCGLYSMSNITAMCLRLSGFVPCAYTAQFFTGVFGGILSTSYEAWLNYEITKIYGENKKEEDKFRKYIFSKILFYDSLLSITVTITGTILFVKYLNNLVFVGDLCATYFKYFTIGDIIDLAYPLVG